MNGTTLVSVDLSRRQLELPDNITAIADGTFRGAKNLEHLDVERLRDLQFIGAYAFADCPKLGGVNLPESVAQIGEGAFSNSTNIGFCRLNCKITELPPHVFAGCTKLSKPTLSEGLQKIGTGAFRGCTSLITLDIPVSLTEIAPDAFEGCSSLSQVIYHEKTQKVVAEQIKQSAKNKKLAIVFKKI